jgi:hypothetical protein
MMAVCLAHHLGLSQAIASVIGKVARCHKCLTFWITLFFLVYIGCDAFIALVLSITMSYLSHYFGLVLMVLNKFYDKLWQKGNR